MLYEIGDTPTVEEEAPAPALSADEPAPEPEAPSSPDAGGGDTPQAQPPATESQPEQPAPAAEAPTPAPAPASPSGETPTDIRTPFAFRVDRSEVQVPGAYLDAEGFVRIPQDQWNRTIQPKLADRTAIQREFQRRDARISELTALVDPERNPDVRAAKALSEAISSRLLAEGLSDDEILDEVARIRGEIPVLTERAKAQALQARLQDYDGARSEQEAVEVLQRSVPLLGQGLTAYVQSALQHPDVAAAGLDANEILSELWGNGTLEELAEVFEDVDDPARADPNRTLRTEGGLVAIRPSVDRVILTAARAAAKTKAAADALLEQERRAFAAKEEAAKRAQEVAAANAKALNGKTTAPPVVGAQGQPGGVADERPWTRLQREASDAQAKGEYEKADNLRWEARREYEKFMGVT